MDVAIQQLLLRLADTLSRRRAHSPGHPLVVVAEEQLLDAAVAALRDRSTIRIGIARRALLIDGKPWNSPNAADRELAGRLHRRGVGAIAFESGINLIDLRAALAWLVAEPGGSSDTTPTHGDVLIMRTKSNPMILDDPVRDAQAAISSLWRVLSAVTGMQDERTGPDPFAQLASEYAGLPMIMDESPAGATGFDTGAILDQLRVSLHDSSVARRTAMALLELTTHGVTTTDDGRALIADQLLSLLGALGRASLAPIVESLPDSGAQQTLVMQTLDLLPVTEALTWLETAAQAQAHSLSQPMVGLMSKLSATAVATHDAANDGMFRDAARELVQGWTLADPDPARHVELLDRIAGFERVWPSDGARRTGASTAHIESSRLVQMSLETDAVGEDTIAAVEALLAAGVVQSLMGWIAAAGDSTAARELRAIATSDTTVRQLLLTEPVDRLEARAMLDALDISDADTLIEILGEAGSKGTRLLVRQRLSEFGDAITPLLLARLGEGPWYLTRNLLSLLRDTETQRRGEGGAAESIAALLSHPQVQVRLEALRVLVGMGGERRAAALGRALRDDNERVVVMALQDLGDATAEHGELPSPMITQIMALVDTGAQSDPVRARAIRALASTRSNVVRDWLIGIVSRKTAILRQLTLAEPTLPAVSALHVLTKLYANDPAAAKVLQLAQGVRHDARWQVRDSGITMERTT